VLVAWGCVSPPRPTEESLRIARNTPATVEGTVRDRQGRPVADVAVQGMPRGEHVPWSPPATTDAGGHFRLQLAAPGIYGFVLSWRSWTVVTPLPEDPARLQIAVEPGGHREGVELVFLREEWEKVLGSEVLSPKS
jgi:hypothetical protein